MFNSTTSRQRYIGLISTLIGELHETAALFQGDDPGYVPAVQKFAAMKAAVDKDFPAPDCPRTVRMLELEPEQLAQRLVSEAESLGRLFNEVFASEEEEQPDDLVRRTCAAFRDVVNGILAGERFRGRS